MRSLLAVVLLLAPVALAAETGYPLIALFRQEQHRGGTQNFDATRDARGRLYFANLEGVLAYDGAWWSRIAVPGSAVFSATADAKGRIAVTSLDQLGYLAPDAKGTLAYHSLLDRVPADLREGIGQGDTCTSADGVLFTNQRFSARWNGNAFSIIERNPDTRARRCFEADGRNYLAAWTGLIDLSTRRKTFEGKRIDIVLPRFVIVRNEGLFHLDETPYDTDASVWLRGKGVMDAKVLQDGRIAIATLRYGLLVMTPDGRIDRIIDAAAGLPDVFLFGVEQDDEGSLWLAMDNCIARVEHAAPVTMFDQRAGLLGIVQTLGRHNGVLYVGTPKGIFAFDRVPARRIPFPETNNPWSLLSSHGDLLAGTYGGLIVLHDDAPAQLIEGTADHLIYEMTPSRRDPSLIWLAMEEGLGTLRRAGNGWRFGGVVPKSAPYVSSIIEQPDGTLWYSTSTDGAVRRSPDGASMHYGKGATEILSVAGRMVIVNGNRFFQPGPNGTLVRDPLLGHITTTDAVLYAGADARGNIWLSTRPPRVVRRRADGTYEREGHAIGAMEGDALNFYADPDGVMWIGGERGLYRIDPRGVAEPRRQPAPAIRRVVDGNERVLFDGTIARTAPATTLPHRFGRVRIEVAPLSYRAKLQYQYRLDPIDSEWSSWTDQAFLDYTNLGANDYTFRFRTRGAGGAISNEARWSFTVLAPWYATRWAFVLWVVLAALLLAAIVWLRTRTLRLRARRLQSLVDEQTVMLRRANDELERLSLADPLTGVANRRAFDRAIAEAWKRAVRHRRGLAVIMLDLDHFKVLNDSQGHTAGDECLRAVAKTMESAVRGNGDDVVARWGGEEFAVLLGDADADAAVAVAQRMRTNIEALGVTASLGVAVRANDADPTALIDRADRALYAAKRAGRNQVQVDEERKSA
jgi:diguanylate cyclase (GGDEF)-like protein